MQKVNNVGSVVWDLENFSDRMFAMRELYSSFIDNGVVELPAEQKLNPFYIDTSVPILIGRARVQLESLFYLLTVCIGFCMCVCV